MSKELRGYRVAGQCCQVTALRCPCGRPGPAPSRHQRRRQGWRRSRAWGSAALGRGYVTDPHETRARQRSELTKEERTAIAEAPDRPFGATYSRRGRTKVEGQLQATVECLAELELRIDDRRESLGVDRRIAAIGVLRNDVRVKDNRALRIDVSAAELQRASEAQLDEQSGAA
jgi:hypothetical protein